MSYYIKYIVDEENESIFSDIEAGKKELGISWGFSCGFGGTSDKDEVYNFWIRFILRGKITHRLSGLKLLQKP
jgi:hypothetical protein